MRDYGRIMSTFWTGETGRKMRGDPACQTLAAYLMSSPLSTMSGIYYIPIVTMVHETGLTELEVRRVLGRLDKELGFLIYDETREIVFVIRMILYQVGDGLKPGDKLAPALRRELAKVRKHPFAVALYSLYATTHQFAGHFEDLARDAAKPFVVVPGADNDRLEAAAQPKSGIPQEGLPGTPEGLPSALPCTALHGQEPARPEPPPTKPVRRSPVPPSEPPAVETVREALKRSRSLGRLATVAFARQAAGFSEPLTGGKLYLSDVLHALVAADDKLSGAINAGEPPLPVGDLGARVVGYLRNTKRGEGSAADYGEVSTGPPLPRPRIMVPPPSRAQLAIAAEDAAKAGGAS